MGFRYNMCNISDDGYGMIKIIPTRMKEKPFNGTSSAAAFALNPQNVSEQKESFNSKTHVSEEACKNYITLLDLDEQKQISNKKDVPPPIKNEVLEVKNEPTCSTMNTVPLENRLKLSDLIPFKSNTNVSPADYLSFGLSPDKR